MFNRHKSPHLEEEGGSFRVPQPLVEAFAADPANPYLVSFSRTGSHWLRMIMEQYFERPTLARAFYFSEKQDFLLLHTHDLDLDVQRTHVIYLYRDPVETIYSQINYHREDHDDLDRIAFWSDLYGRHLDKWLHREDFTVKKHILTYEGMKRDLAAEFSKVTDFFGVLLDVARLTEVASRVTKEEVKSKTTHDPQVVQLEKGYEMTREVFGQRHRDHVWDALTRQGRAHLRGDFEAR